MQSFLSPRAAMLAAAMALAPALSVAPGQAQTLNIGIGAPITSLDPHFFNAGPNNGMATHIFRFLTQRDAGLQLRADLAESWTAVSETVWEFKLRQGVTWHDGRPLTAEDVAFTVARAPNVPNSPGGYGGFLAGIQRLEVVDAHTVRFHMASPSPLLPSNQAAVAIIAKHAADGGGRRRPLPRRQLRQRRPRGAGTLRRLRARQPGRATRPLGAGELPHDRERRRPRRRRAGRRCRHHRPDPWQRPGAAEDQQRAHHL
jgi:ABC-type transport system substrate-binding protein